jgi:N-acyl-D-aspartate/D-glutamate deacylase
MFDLIIKNGKIVDGTGSPSKKEDLGITGDRIEKIGNLQNAEGRKIIDAEGKYVIPGIIDIHSHADLTIYKDEHPEILKPLVAQGITTFVGGNCGIGVAPIGEENLSSIKTYLEGFTGMEMEKEIKWRSFKDFVEFLEKRGTLLNTALLAPHGIIRISVLGMKLNSPNTEQMNKMKNYLREALENGAFGISTGLQYFPGLQSETEELIELAKVVKNYNGIFASHIRSYTNTLEMAIEEIVQISTATDVYSHISHIFWIPDMGRIGPYLRALIRGAAKISKYFTIPFPLDIPLNRIVQKVNNYRKNGIKIGMDVMPTTTGFTHLLAFFPPWVLEGSRKRILVRLRNREIRKKILKDIEEGKTVWPHHGNSWSLNLFKIMGWECARIMEVEKEKNKKYIGRNITSIAKELKMHPFDFICDLLLEEDGRVLIFESIAEPDDNFTERAMFGPIKDRNVSISTDTILLGNNKPSPLFYGCYPKFLTRYVRDKKMLSLEDAVKKITGLPADSVNLKKRGYIKEGYFADIVIFDFEKLENTSTFQTPERYPEGIDYVIINGKIVKEKEIFDFSHLPGKVLKRE